VAHSSRYPAPARRQAFCIEQLRDVARAAALHAHGLEQSGPAPLPASVCEVLALSEDLLLARTEVMQVPEAVHGTAWQFDFRGWLFMHLRLDGISRELDREGREHLLGARSFLLSSSGSRVLPVRQVVGENWRTVGIACRPSFVSRELGIDEEALPALLRDLSAEAPTGFWIAGSMDDAMLQVARNLSRPPVTGSTREIYLRAKTVELLCLALEHLEHPRPCSDAPVRLSARDLQCLYDARALLDSASVFPGLDGLGRAVGLNRNKLSAGFKHLFGESAAAYYRGGRLEQARGRLLRGESCIARIADEAGYNDPGSFSKAFRQRYGLLPSQVLVRRAP